MPVWTSQWRRNGTCVSTAVGHGAVVPPCPVQGKPTGKPWIYQPNIGGGSGKLSLQPFQEMEWNLGWYGVWPLGLFPIWGAMMVMIVDVDGAPNVDVVAFYCIVNCESIFLNMFEMQLLITKPPRMIPRGWTWGRSENMRGSSTTFNSPYVVGGEMFCLQKWIDMAHLLYIPIFFGFLKNVWFLFPASFIIFPYTRPFGFRPPQTRSLEGSSGKGSVLLFRAEPGSKFRCWW